MTLLLWLKATVAVLVSSLEFVFFLRLFELGLEVLEHLLLLVGVLGLCWALVRFVLERLRKMMLRLLLKLFFHLEL
jgi:hypothetical protein